MGDPLGAGLAGIAPLRLWMGLGLALRLESFQRAIAPHLSREHNQQPDHATGDQRGQEEERHWTLKLPDEELHCDLTAVLQGHNHRENRKNKRHDQADNHHNPSLL